MTSAHDPLRHENVGLLNDILATELVCMLRCGHHQFTADGPKHHQNGEEFLAHANQAHERTDDDDCPDLNVLLSFGVVPKCDAVQRYLELFELMGDNDTAVAHLLEDILAEEEQHPSGHSAWLSS